MYVVGNFDRMVLPTTAGHRGDTSLKRGGPSQRRVRGFTLLELHIALAVLAIGILGLSGLMVRQSRQIARIEAWCKPDQTYYVVGQTYFWMRMLRAPADLATDAGQEAWTPSVSGEQNNEVTLLSYNQQGQTMSAQGTLQPIGGGE